MERKPRNYREQKMQIGVVYAFRTLERQQGGFSFFAVHNGGLVESKEAAALRKAMGVRPGVSDLVFLLEGGKTVLIELKDAETGVITDEQKNFHATAGALGHCSYVVAAAGRDDAINQISKILADNGWTGVGHTGLANSHSPPNVGAAP